MNLEIEYPLHNALRIKERYFIGILSIIKVKDIGTVIPIQNPMINLNIIKIIRLKMF